MYSAENVYQNLESFIEREFTTIQRIIGNFTWERNPYCENIVLKGNKHWWLGEVNSQKLYLTDMRGKEYILNIK